MLGLCVNTYVDAVDKEEYKLHKMKASIMDLGDISVPRIDFNMPADEGMPVLERDDDKPLPSTNLDTIIQSLDITPL